MSAEVELTGTPPRYLYCRYSGDGGLASPIDHAQQPRNITGTSKYGHPPKEN